MADDQGAGTGDERRRRGCGKGLAGFVSDDRKARVKEAVGRLYDIIAILRGDGGCPWDRAQTHQSLDRYLLEEAWEVIDAIRTGEMNKLCEELGDLLLQIGLHARIAQEHGYFDLGDVALAISEKMIRRHPHVFGNGEFVARTPEEVVSNWELIKMREAAKAAKRGDLSEECDGTGEGTEDLGETREEYRLGEEMGRIPAHWPATLQAERIQKLAGRVGFDWPDSSGVLDKVREELEEVRVLLKLKRRSEKRISENGTRHEERPDGGEIEGRLEEEIGDLLFSVVNLARFEGINPEKALRNAVRRFGERFGLMEKMAAKQGLRLSEMGSEDMDKLWEAAKSHEKDRPLSGRKTGGYRPKSANEGTEIER
ncbi:MAG TPA: nucleoside triphosphate pyrophosphohydrolase [Clostridia bacterium]|nr:nucleoside triphosphate pyrophosphohydrolase [Clostridia bacterium]